MTRGAKTMGLVARPRTRQMAGKPAIGMNRPSLLMTLPAHKVGRGHRWWTFRRARFWCAAVSLFEFALRLTSTLGWLPGLSDDHLGIRTVRKTRSARHSRTRARSSLFIPAQPWRSRGFLEMAFLVGDLCGEARPLVSLPPALNRAKAQHACVLRPPERGGAGCQLKKRP